MKRIFNKKTMKKMKLFFCIRHTPSVCKECPPSGLSYDQKGSLSLS